jgi:hypothetical protein
MPHKGQEEIMKKATQPAQPAFDPQALAQVIAMAVAQVLAQALAQPVAPVVTAPEPVAPMPAEVKPAEPKPARKRKVESAQPEPEPKPARKAKAKVEPAKPTQPAEPKRARKVTEPVAQPVPVPEAKPAQPAKAKPRRKASQLEPDSGVILRIAAHLSKVDPWRRGVYRLAEILERRVKALGSELARMYIARIGQLEGKEAVKFALLGVKDLRAQLGKGER